MSKQYNIRWKQSDSDDLRKAVKNFNAKITRLEKKNPEIKNALPDRVTVKQMKELIDTRQDLNRELNALRRFSRRGAETLVEVPDNDYNLKTTKWQRNEMNRRVAIINRKREKRLKELHNVEVTSKGEPLGYTRGQARMGQADEVALRPMKAFTKGMNRTALNKKFETIMKESQTGYWNKRELQLMENYKKALRENFNPEDIADVLDAIDDMGFSEFYEIFQADAEKFEAPYRPDDEHYGDIVQSLKSTWIPKGV